MKLYKASRRGKIQKVKVQSKKIIGIEGLMSSSHTECEKKKQKKKFQECIINVIEPPRSP